MRFMFKNSHNFTLKRMHKILLYLKYEYMRQKTTLIVAREVSVAIMLMMHV